MIDQPGIYPDLPIEQYHAGPGYSSSQLKQILRESPFAFYHEHVLGAQAAKDPGKWGDTRRPLAIGGATAALMDGEDVFAAGYVVLDETAAKASKLSNDFKLAWRAAVEGNPGKTVILPTERGQAEGIAEAIHNHPDPWTRDQLQSLFDNPDLRAECSFYHRDAETGLLVKTRPDLGIPRSFLADAKTSTDCGEYPFSKRILDQGHHIQAAMGLDIVNKAEQCMIENWMLIVVEQSPPHDVAVYYLDKPTLALGYRQYRAALTRLAECLRADKWPGKAPGINPINVPAWALNAEEMMNV